MAEAGLAETIAELRVMHRRDREAVMASLSAGERERVGALLSGRVPPERSREKEEAEAIFSAWLAARLEEGRWSMTGAGRAALAEAMRDVSAGARGAGAEAEAAAARPSLASAVGGLFARRRRDP